MFPGIKFDLRGGVIWGLLNPVWLIGTVPLFDSLMLHFGHNCVAFIICYLLNHTSLVSPVYLLYLTASAPGSSTIVSQNLWCMCISSLLLLKQPSGREGCVKRIRRLQSPSLSVSQSAALTTALLILSSDIWHPGEPGGVTAALKWIIGRT